MSFTCYMYLGTYNIATLRITAYKLTCFFISQWGTTAQKKRNVTEKLTFGFP